MWQLKRLLDPNGILNPDVVLSDDPAIHLKNLATARRRRNRRQVHRVRLLRTRVPSKGLTLSPRQRIVMWRDIQAARRRRHPRAEAHHQYQGIDTCAATGLCASAARWASTPASW